MTYPTRLDQYRRLGHSGLLVSPLSLGTMTFGTDNGVKFGSDKEESRRILDRYAELGGNFLDTANRYTKGTSETFLGEFLEGRRQRFVLATKYSITGAPGVANSGGNARKTMMEAVTDSLKRLRTDYIDLYWVHAWDGRTPIDEVMRGLDDLVRQGKVLYVGISDTPAWKVAQANTLAELRGWSRFIGLQIEYSLAQRTPERELLPMARDLDLGVTPWSPLAGGVLTGKFASTTSIPEDSGREGFTKGLGVLTDRVLGIATVVKAIASETGATPAQVALQWVVRQPGVTSTIFGAKRMDQLEDNLGALAVDLTDAHLARLDEASRIELGFPHDFLRRDMVKGFTTGGVTILD
jgi:aryl-alcohol dehydrogenase-like predicted oxidoreductase